MSSSKWMLIGFVWVCGLFPFVAAAAFPVATPASVSPFAIEFGQLRLETSNSQVLQILLDDDITPEEYRSLQRGFSTCMLGLGYHVTFEPDQFIPGTANFAWTIPPASPEATPTTDEEAFAAYDEAFGECIPVWGPAMALYSNMLVNPENEDLFELNLDCLHAYRLVPDDFDRVDLDNAAATGDWGSDIDPSSESFTTCLVNPLQIGLDVMPISLESGTPSPGTDATYDWVPSKPNHSRQFRPRFARSEQVFPVAHMIARVYP